MSDFLAQRAMLADLSISQWSGYRLDRKVTAAVNRQNGASSDAGRFNKSLVPTAALAAVNKAAGAARSEMMTITMPWRNDGARLLPAALYVDFMRRMASHKDAFNAAVADFLQSYPALVANAPARLGDMYNPGDFPSENALERKFGFSVNLFNVPAGDDVRIDLAAEQVESIRADIERATAEAHAAAVRDVFARMADVTSAMADKLKAFKPRQGEQKATGIFRDSLVGNVADLVAILPAFNLSGDAALARLTDRMRRDLLAHDATELRESDSIRATVATKAEEILAEISDFM